jgi:hypothetical protein
VTYKAERFDEPELYLSASWDITIASDAAIFFEAFCRRRQIFIKWARRVLVLVRSFHQQWLQQSEAVTTAAMEERKAKTKRIPGGLNQELKRPVYCFLPK